MKELARLMNEIKEQNELKDKEISILHKQIDKLTNKLQIQNINNNTQNNTLNNIQNNFHIKLLNHSQTDYSHLSDKDYIHCMASGEKEGVSKFYFYAEQNLKSGNTTRLYMVECSVTKATKHIAFVFKTGSQGVQNPQLYIESFINIVRNRIKSIID